MQLISSVIFFCLTTFSLIAQQPTSINYTIKNGLLSNEVYDLFEDKDGFIWIASNKGVNRFNSNEIQSLSISDGIADRDVLSLHQDCKGNIWFLSYNGKLSYWREGKIYNEQNDASLKEIVPSSFFCSFLEDTAGNLWFGTYVSGIYKMDSTGSVTHFAELNVNNPKHVSDSIIANPYLYEDSIGNIRYSNYIGNSSLINGQFNFLHKHPKNLSRSRMYSTEKHLYLSSGNQVFKSDISNGNFLWESTIALAERINGIEIFSDGLIYVASDNGVFSFDQNGNKVDSLLIGKKVSDILIDREGNLWVSTLFNGIFLFKNRNVLNYNTEAKYSIHKTKDSILFGGVGIKIHSLTKDGLHYLPIKYEKYRLSLDQDKILTFAEDANSQIYFGSYNGLFQLGQGEIDQGIWLGVKKLFYFNQDLFVTSNDYLLRLDKEAMDFIFSFVLSDNNTALIDYSALIKNKYSIHSKMLHCLSSINDAYFLGGTDEGVVRYMDSVIHPLDYLPKGKIIAIKQEKTGNIWMLEEDKGLYYYRLDREELDTIVLFKNKEEVLHTALWLEKDSNLWVGTDKGLVHVKLKGEDFSISHINKKDGLASEEINDLIIIDEYIWMATSKGISSLPKESLKDTVVPYLYMDSIVVNERKLDSIDLFSLTSIDNTLSVFFTGISFKDEGELWYEYELIGSTSQKGIVSNSVVVLLDLEPSDYTLSITAIDSAGNRSALKKTTFKIILQWYKNWRYLLLILLGFFLIVGLSFRFILERRKRLYLEELKNRPSIVVKSILDGSKVQIFLEELLYIKGARDYVEVFSKQKKLTVRATMKGILKDLEEDSSFMRVHKSYIVNLQNVDFFKSGILKIGDETIPVGRAFHNQVKEYFDSLDNL